MKDKAYGASKSAVVQAYGKAAETAVLGRRCVRRPRVEPILYRLEPHLLRDIGLPAGLQDIGPCAVGGSKLGGNP
jgi:hypothetical protein